MRHDTLNPNLSREEIAGFLRSMKVDCGLCGLRFVPDVEGPASRDLDQIALRGRTFHGISEEAHLCPVCDKQMQAKGAQRLYWEMAHL